MQINRDVGKIEQLFAWNVPLSDVGQDYVDVCYTSPHFRLTDSSWYMTFGTQHEGWIGLFLIMVDSGSPKTIKYTLEINTTGGDKTFTKTHIFKRSNASSGEAKLLKLSEMKGLSQLKITCRINNYTTASLQETPNIVSCVNQTEISDITSRSIQAEFPDSGPEEENSKDKDWSLLDKKERIKFMFRAIQTETPNSVSCAIQAEVPDSVSSAIQTEVPDSVSCANQTEILESVSCAIQTEIPHGISCAIQTEIPDSETRKENFENEDWHSLLDTKELEALKYYMKDLNIHGNDHDVTIDVQGKKFRIRRNILKACSSIFGMMFTHDQDCTQKIISGMFRLTSEEYFDDLNFSYKYDY